LGAELTFLVFSINTNIVDNRVYSCKFIFLPWSDKRSVESISSITRDPTALISI
jgi:hypothetical protein